MIRILPSLLWKSVDDKHDITGSKMGSEIKVEKMSSQSMDHHPSNVKVFSSSLRARRSDSGEECAIYHTTNRDTTFCGDQIVSPNTPDRHISLAKLAGAGAVISHRITNYHPPH